MKDARQGYVCEPLEAMISNTSSKRFFAREGRLLRHSCFCQRSAYIAIPPFSHPGSSCIATLLTNHVSLAIIRLLRYVIVVVVATGALVKACP